MDNNFSNKQFLNRHSKKIMQSNIPAFKLQHIIEKYIHGNVHDINFTKSENCRIRKIRVFENGRSVESFSIQSLKICKVIKGGEEYVQIKKLRKQSLKHVHFNDCFDLVKTKLSQKKKKVPALLINVHGNVYYPDGDRRYDKLKRE